MALRLLAACVALLLLGSCGNDPNKKAAIDEVDRRHTEDMQRVGSGSM